MNNAEKEPNEYPKGFWINPPHQNSPDYIKAKVHIIKDQFLTWLQGKQEKDLYLNINKSKEGNTLYIVVDNWKPDPNYKKKAANKEEVSYEVKKDPSFTADDIPF